MTVGPGCSGSYHQSGISVGNFQSVNSEDIIVIGEQDVTINGDEKKRVAKITIEYVDDSVDEMFVNFEELKIQIHGNCENIEINSGSIEVEGNVDDCGTNSGTITANTINTSCRTNSGKIKASTITGGCNSTHGNIEAGTIKGRCTSVHGNIEAGTIKGNCSSGHGVI